MIQEVLPAIELDVARMTMVGGLGLCRTPRLGEEKPIGAIIQADSAGQVELF